MVECFYNASFLNVDTGFISGLGSKIYKTFDGGESWEVVFSSSLGGPYYRWIQFTSVDTGYVGASETGYADALLLKTTDGGLNLDPAWPTVFTLPPFSSNKNFQFLTTKIGYAGINDIYKTVNEGGSWSELTVLNNSLSMALFSYQKILDTLPEMTVLPVPYIKPLMEEIYGFNVRHNIPTVNTTSMKFTFLIKIMVMLWVPLVFL